MGAPSVHEVTQLLRVWSAGDQNALDKLTPLVYRELHRSAKRYMARQQPDHTLQTTALVNEVYLRLVAFKEVSWADCAHFFAVCAPGLLRTHVGRRAENRTRNGLTRYPQAQAVRPRRREAVVGHEPSR